MAAISTCTVRTEKMLGIWGRPWCATNATARMREQCFIEDEGRSLGVGLHELASNHLKLRGLRVRVVSVGEKAEANSVR